VRVLVAEDDFLVREGVRRVVEAQPGCEVVGVAADFDGVLAAARALRPDVVVMDVRMPPHHGMEGIEAAHRIRRERPEVGVVVLTQHDDEEYVWELLKHGVSGLAYLRKIRVAHAEQLGHAIREVARGGSVIDPEIVAGLVAHRRRTSPLAALTPGELDVLRLMAEGKTNAGIARAMVVQPGAVEKHISSIFSKLELPATDDDHRRVLAVLTFLRA
jgi:DNA-binding NarL/FixJ family response regulator